MDEARTNNNVGYRCHYHVVWCPKYRRTVIDRQADTRRTEINREACTERNAPIGA